MRIAWIVPGGFDESGRERVVPSWLSLLRRIAARHAVVVFTAGVHDTARTYPLLGATIVDLGRPRAARGLRLISQYRALARLVAAKGPFDVFHGFWAVPGGVLAAAVARRSGVPSLVTFDSGEFVSCPDIKYGLQRTWQGRLQVRLAAAWASRVTVCSEHMRGLAVAHGIEADLAPLGVDEAAFSTDRGRPEGPPWRLLHVASLNRVKDQPTLVHALSRIVSRVPDTHLDVVGEDTLGGAIQALAARIGVSHHVTFHGFQPADRLRDFYARAHLLVQSSRHEAAGVAVVEAAAAGVPTVGTRVGNVADWSPDAARAVPVGDAAALGDAVVSVLEDRGQRERLAAAALDRAAALHADRTTRRFEELYQSLAESRVADRLGSSQEDRSR
jgi:glycosyltransferase involved in cell wall biosynthesis